MWYLTEKQSNDIIRRIVRSLKISTDELFENSKSDEAMFQLLKLRVERVEQRNYPDVPHL